MGIVLFGKDIGNTGSAISKIFSFWGSSMVSVLPKAMQSKLTVGEEYILVNMRENDAQIFSYIDADRDILAEIEKKDEYLVAEISRVVKKEQTKDQKLLLSLDDETVLEKKLSFPRVMKDNIKQSIFYDIEKHIPFKKEDVLYDVVIDKEDKTNIYITLFVVHKEEVLKQLANFKSQGVLFDAMITDSSRRLNLLPATFRRKQKSLRLGRNWFYIILIMLLMLASLAIPLYLKRETAIELGAEVDRLALKAKGESELWDQKESKEELFTSFINSRPVSFSSIYEEISKLFPDDTWVSFMTLVNGQVTVRGESADAASLVPLLNKSILFKDAKLTAPIVSSRRTNKETFKIAFSVVSGGSQ